jgi:fructoselysine-6-P-deglycase FrlB-like protein
MEILRENTLVAVLEGASATRELNQKLLRDVSRSPAQAFLIGYHGALASLRIAASSPRILPILEVLPFEMMTLALAYLFSMEAGVFQRGTKVTVTE